MILSPYHNPPYRTPTPKTSTSPQRSPKRQRGDGACIPPLRLHPTTQTQDEQLPGMNSPRMQVTEKFRDLNIQPGTIRPPGLRTNGRNPGTRKRLKRSPEIAQTTSLDDLSIAETPQQTRQPVPSEVPTAINEIEETPDHRAWVQVSPPSSPRVSKESDSAQESPNTIKVAPRLSSPPLPRAVQSEGLTAPAILDSADRPVSPLPLRGEISSDQAALTWQEDEITGHDIDPASDDDGEGINGIGFKPTPAIAYARRQRRKQQVNEWKAREAREARQKRFERRRGAAADIAVFDCGAEYETKRAVRFAEVG